jgi:hypothetical protein
MKKIRLELDTLAIESFETTGPVEARGTVQGHIPPYSYQIYCSDGNTCVIGNSCFESCGATCDATACGTCATNCGTCQATQCGTCYDASCCPTYCGTCDPYCCCTCSCV